ncbi:MAG: RNA polymerase sigma factor [Vicinamibacteraceae bacterium]
MASSSLSTPIDRDLNALAFRAAAGDRDALERICIEIQDSVYRLALRFLDSPEDAEDCTQEILIQVITHLGSFEGRSKFTTWVYTIASRYLVRTRKRRVEASVQGAEPFAAWLDEHLAPEPYRADTAAEYRMLCDEVRIGCTYAMLLTLSRGLRIAYILGDLLEMTDQEGAEALGITPAAFRQRVARARQAVLPILAKRCGLVDPAGSCDCGRIVEPSIACGLIPQGKPVLTRLQRERPTVDPAAFRRAADQLDIAERFAGLFRVEPQFQAPASVLTELRRRCPDLLGEAT